MGLRGGSRVTGRLSARGLANVEVGDWSDDFTFIIGDHRYRCGSSVAQFLSPRVAKLHLIDATISELRLEGEDPDRLFGSVLEAAGGCSITVDSLHRGTFLAICTALWNSDLRQSVYGQVSDPVTMENVVDGLRFLSATRCDILTELEFIASHFYFFLCRRDQLEDLPFSMIYQIIGSGFLRLESEDSLYDFIKKGIRTNWEIFGLLEFVRLEYCSTDVVNNFFNLLSGPFCEINASMWANLRARLVLSKRILRFPPSMKKGNVRHEDGNETKIDVPDGIIAHLTRECGGNVHDRHVVEVTSGSFEQEIYGANRYSGALNDDLTLARKNAVDLEAGSSFSSAYRVADIPHTMNNWVCCDFKERRFLPTHYAIRTNYYPRRGRHLKSWLVETSADGEKWREVAREEVNGDRFTGTFAVAGGGECRFIRLVNIGRNHNRNDYLCISAWEIFGRLIE
jgi:hypothetical protein